MIATREEVVETVEIAKIVETTGAGKDNKKSKGNYLGNLI